MKPKERMTAAVQRYMMRMNEFTRIKEHQDGLANLQPPAQAELDAQVDEARRQYRKARNELHDLLEADDT